MTNSSRMRICIQRITVAVMFLGILGALAVNAALQVTATATKVVGRKVVVTLGITNTFPEKVESARATVFLLDERGKVVVQGTKWIIGGSDDKARLGQNAGTVFHFVLETEKAFVTNRVFLNRVVLEGGKVVALPFPNLKPEPGQKE